MNRLCGGRHMTKDQKIVAVGAASGIVGMILLVWLIAANIPEPAVIDSNGDRLAYAFRWSVVAVLPLFAMLAAIGNARFLGEAIDPTLGKESQSMIIDGRVADNTLQQFVCFLVGICALSVSVPIDRISYVPAVATTFTICRIVFWVGYRIRPLYRAPGFASTASMNLLMYMAVIWLRLT
jgi:hypothetical protein